MHRSALAGLRVVRGSGSGALSLAAARRRLSHVCIVGSGPAGFYTAKYLTERHPSLKVDILEKFPVPFGLVRFGVAPDHPEVKTVISTFREVATNGRVRFFGNISVGTDVSVEELQQNYTAVVLAYGASSDRRLGIPGEDLDGVLSARSFVNWYNGHPDFATMELDLSKVRNVVVIGQGNVALDCARILTRNVDELRDTDIASYAIDQLERSAVETVTVAGRRGHVQAAFTIKEIRELSRLPGVQTRILQEELDKGLTEASQAELSSQRPKKRINDLLCEIAKQSDDANAQGQRQVNLRFLLSPVEFLPSSTDPQQVGAVRFERTKLEGELGVQRAWSTGEFEELPCDLVLKSIGYKSHPLPGLPFDSRTHTIPQQAGRILQDSEPLRGWYVTGWLKRGPSGIIAANIIDAKETTTTILEDLEGNVLQDNRAPNDAFESKLRELGVTWEQYERIEQEELRRGAEKRKPMEKLVTPEEMLKIARALHRHSTQ